MPTSPRWSSNASLRAFGVERLAVAIGCGVVVLGGAPGRALGAESSPRVVVVDKDVDSTRFRRLAAELRSLGLIVVSVQAEGNGAPEETLPEVARREHAMAAIQVLTLPHEEQVWVADRVTNKTVVRELSRDSSRPDQTDDSIAVGVAELLRASLMEVNSESRARGDYPPTARVRELALSPPRTVAHPKAGLWIAALAGLQPSLRGASSAWIFQGGAVWRASTGFGIQLMVGGTLSPVSVEGTAGSAHLASQWVGVGPSLSWSSRAPWLHGELGLLFGANRVTARGEQVVAPLVSAAETAYSPSVAFHGGPAFGAGGFRLLLDFNVLLLSSPARVYLAEQRAAVWGAPAVQVTLGLAGHSLP